MVLLHVRKSRLGGINTGLLVVIVSFEENDSEVEFIHFLVVPTLACFQDLFALEFQMLLC